MNGRLLVLFALGWYSVSSTDAPFRLLDWISPLGEGTDAGGFPCAGHVCGCRTETDCRSECCCAGSLPRGAHPANQQDRTAQVAPLNGRLLLISDARCHGRRPDGSLVEGVKAGPHLVPQAFELASTAQSPSGPVLAATLPPSISPAPPGKVPR